MALVNILEALWILNAHLFTELLEMSTEMYVTEAVYDVRW